MELLIGTSDGVFVAGGAGRPTATDGLAGQTVRVLQRANGNLFAGGDSGVFRSGDGGRSWKLSGAEGKIVWDIAPAPGDSRTVYAGTQPPALFRTNDGGDSWAEVGPLTKVPGSERWCVPNSPLGARARTVVLDRANPARQWVGLEVGGILATSDGGETWTCDLPGDNPDIHVMGADPVQPGLLYATTGFGRPADDPIPMCKRIAGLFRSKDAGQSWEYLWAGMSPPYTRPMCVDPRAPYAVTVGCAPSAFASHKDPGGAKSMLYQSTDRGDTWRSLGDADHSPSAANILAVTVAPESAGSVLIGTDTGEVWRVTPQAEWTLLASDLPAVQSILPLG